jgi:predicted ribosomally synthesized peptide with SipW-like signal peptide
MSFSKSKIAVVGAFGAGALALVGVGTGATFTQDVSSSQQVTAGTMNMQLSAPSVPGATVGSGGLSVTLPATSPENSTFDTGAKQVIMTNKGNIPVDAFYLKVSDDVTGTSSAASQALKSQLFARVISDGYVLYDGPLSALESLGQLRVDGPIPVDGTDEIETEFYAGAVPALGSNVCGTPLLGGVCPAASAPSLTNDAEGGVVTPTLTITYNG